MGRLTRRSVLAGGAAIGAGTLAAARIAQAQTSGPIKIGFIVSMSGAAAVYGKSIHDGTVIAVDRMNKAGGVLGRKVEMSIRDDLGKPDGTVAAFQEMSGQGINLFSVGPFTPPILSVLPLLQPAKAVMVSPGPSSMAITHESYNPNNFRVGFPAVMAYASQARVMAQKFPDITTWVGILHDIGSYHDLAQQFADGLTENYRKFAKKDVKILDPIFVKMASSDFKQQLAQLMSSEATGLFNAFAGQDGITFYQQSRAFGLDGKYKVISDAGLGLAVPQALGVNTPQNLWGFVPWYAGANPENKVSQEVNRDYIAMTNDEVPFWPVGCGHDAMWALMDAVRRAGGTDPAMVMAAMESGDPLGCMGPVVFRKEDHQYVGDVTFLHYGADAKAKGGWSVLDVVRVPGREAVERATPGQKYA